MWPTFSSNNKQNRKARPAVHREPSMVTSLFQIMKHSRFVLAKLASLYVDAAQSPSTLIKLSQTPRSPIVPFFPGGYPEDVDELDTPSTVDIKAISLTPGSEAELSSPSTDDELSVRSPIASSPRSMLDVPEIQESPAPIPESQEQPKDEQPAQESHAEKEWRERGGLVLGLAEALVKPLFAQLLGYENVFDTIYTEDAAENETLDATLHVLTQRVATWLDWLELVPLDKNEHGPQGTLIPLALWIIWQLPVAHGFRSPVEYPGPSDSPLVDAMRELLCTSFSDRDDTVDAVERLVVLGLSLAERCLHDFNDKRLLRRWHKVSGIPLSQLNEMDSLAIRFLDYQINPLREPYIAFLRFFLTIHTHWHPPSRVEPHQRQARSALQDVLWDACGVTVYWEQESDDEEPPQTPPQSPKLNEQALTRTASDAQEVATTIEVEKSGAQEAESRHVLSMLPGVSVAPRPLRVEP